MEQNFGCGGSILGYCGPRTYMDSDSILALRRDVVLLVGQTLSTFTRPLIPVRLNRRSNYADETFGAGSMLAIMVDRALAADPNREYWVLPVEDFGAQGNAEIEIQSLPQRASTFQIMINGNIYGISVSPEDTTATIATRLIAAINLNSDRFGYTAGTSISGTSFVSIETKCGGTVGGWLDVRTVYYRYGIEPPDGMGVNVTVTQGTGTFPLPATVSDVIGEGNFTFIAWPYNDVAAMASLRDWLCVTWHPQDQFMRKAESFTAVDQTIDAAGATASAMNKPFMKMFWREKCPLPPYSTTAAITAQAAAQMATDRPVIRISMPFVEQIRGEIPFDIQDRPTSADLADAIYVGLAPFQEIAETGGLRINKYVTTYTTNGAGNRDIAWNMGNEPAALRLIQRKTGLVLWNTLYISAYREDGVPANPGQDVIDQAQIKGILSGVLNDLSVNDHVIQNVQQTLDNALIRFDDETGCVVVEIDPDLLRQICCLDLYVTRRFEN